MLSISDRMINKMMVILDNQEEIIGAYDQEISKAMLEENKNIIHLASARADECKKYCDLHDAFEKILNCNYSDSFSTLKIIHYIKKNANGKHEVGTFCV